MKCWKHHTGSVSNLTWSPDSKHFASIGQDNKLYFCSIFEPLPLCVIETPATGMVWDPLGLFLATQSSEEKSLKIWRVSNIKNVTQVKEIKQYYENNRTGMIRKPHWSPDGAFVSGVCANIGKRNFCPLVNRNSWEHEAFLMGEISPIMVSKWNPYIFSDGVDPTSGKPKAYSICAIGGSSSNLSIWSSKSGSAVVIVTDLSVSMITDISWGFNGNVLLASTL